MAKKDDLILEQTAIGKELDAKKSELDAKIVKLAELDKTGAELSAELKKRIQIVDDFSDGKISNEQYQASIQQLPQFLDRTYAWLAAARKIMTDEKSIVRLDILEKNIQKLAARSPMASVAKVV